MSLHLVARALAFVFFNLILLSNLSATHIVGGEMNYRCLGNNQYEIRLTVYRDCYNGVPYFDQPASIGFFSSSNQYLFQLRLNVTNDDTLSPRLYDPCVTTPPDICYHKTTYVGTVSLPFRAGGYQIVYQRCCRNMTINNLVNPSGTGATYYTYITEQGLLTCNSNPVFRKWPEPLICNNIPIDFDHSASDLNNDSLVYDLVTPLNGASTSNPMPQPPNAPPFANVTWAPGYSLANILNGSVPLTINSRTGRLTGMPGAVGQYVVGIRVREYRNGTLMSVTQRDFQYNIGVCGIINNAAFFAPEMRCQENSLQVTFTNQSIAQFPEFHWDFGVPTINSDTSNLRNPVYTFNRRGTYNVRLIVGRGGCIDTAYQTLLVDYKSLDARFSFVKQTCTQQALIQFNNQTTDSLYAVSSYNWDLGNGQTTTAANPLATYTQSGTYTVRLRAVNAIGCIDTFSRTFTLSLPQFNAYDTLRICPSGTGTSSVTINPNAPINSAHRYSWSPTTGLNNPNIANPIASPTVTTTYRVRISAYNAPDTCILEKNVTVYVSPRLIVHAPSDTVVCSSTVLLQVTVSSSAVSPIIVWQRVVNGGTLVQVGTGATYNYISTQAVETFRVVVTDRYGCAMSKNLIVRYQPAQISPNFVWAQVGNCTDTLTLSLRENALPSGSYTYSWNFGSQGTSSQATPSIRVVNQGSYPIALTVTNASGCYGIDRDTVRFVRPQQVSMPSQYAVCQGDSVFVGNTPTAGATYSWSPATYLSHPFASSTFIKPVQSMAYVLTIRSSGAGYNCSATQSVNVTVPQPWEMNTQNDTLVCSNQFTLTASANTAQSINYQWFNITSGRPVNMGNQQTLSTVLNGNTLIMLVGTDVVGCLRRDTFLVTVAPNQLMPVASVSQVGTCSRSINLQFQATATGFRGAALSGYNWLINGITFNTASVQSNFVGSQTLTASLMVTDVNGCMGSTLLNVPIKPFPLVVSTPSNTAVCSGSSQTIGLTAEPDLTYQWSSNIPSSQQTNSQVTFAATASGAYQQTITWSQNSLTCSDTKDYSINVAPPIQKQVSADTSVCGGLVALTATALTPVRNILWFATYGTSPSLASGSTYSPSINSNSIFYTQFTDNAGCAVWDSVKVTFNPNVLLPQLTVSQVGSCSDSLRVRYNAVNVGPFNASPATYNWYFSNGMTQTSQSPEFVVRSNQTLTANITITTNDGCYGIASNAVQVQFPELTLPTAQASICKGDTVRVAMPNVAGQTYLWLPIAQVYDPNTSTGLLTPSATTNFTVVASTQVNGFTCRKRANVLVNVTGDIPLTTMPDTTVCGGFTELRASTDATSSITWLIRRNNRFQVVGQGNIRPFFITQDTTFFAMASNSQGCKTIDSVKLDFNEKLVYADFTYVQSNCSDNITLMFNDQSTSPSGIPVSWNWQFGDGQRSTLQNPRININQSGQLPIRLQVSLNNDCISLAYDTLNFKFPSIDIPTSPVSRCWYRNGVNLSNVNTTTNDQTLSYQWSPSTGLNNANIANPIASPTEATTYQVTVTGETLNATCSIVRSVNVNVPTPFSVDVPEQSKTCGNFFDYTAPEGSKPQLRYNWYAGNPNQLVPISNDRSLNVALAGRDTMFYFIGSDNFGCYHKDSMRISIDSNSIPVRFSYNFGACSNTVQVNFAEQVLDTFPNPIARYSWTFGNGSTSIARRPSITYNQSGDFPIRLQVVKQNGCKGEKTDTIRYNAPILPQYKNNINRCHRDTVALLGTATSSPNVQYQWAPSIGLSNPRVLNPLAAPAANIVYTISVTGNINQQNCYNSGRVTVTVPPQIQANLQPKFSSCSDTAQISVNSNAPNLRYQWFDNNRQNLNQSTQTIRLFAPLENQTFSVVITDANNCSITEKTEVVNKKINILVPPTINVCKADSFHIQAKTTTAQQDVKWSWSPFQNIAQFNQNSVSGLVTQSTQFTVAATNDVGCRDSKTIQIQVINDFPTANATVSKRIVYEGEDVQLNTTNNPQYTYQWKSESPLSNVRIPNPTSRPMQPQTLYQLSVRNQYGCLTQDTITVIRKSFMCKDPYIFVPNAFTPNGDNENDVLYARSAVTDKTYFAVFNRWGEMVFETHDKAIGWDGTFKGQVLEPDVFAYYLKVQCIGGQVFEKRGNVSLLK